MLLAAAFAADGADILALPAVADDEAAHRAALEQGLDADVLVTSGGVSVGPHELVRDLLGELGVREVFWGVAVKPGKPVAFGVRARTLVFGLPGNPVSSLVAAELFVRPALLALQGVAEPGPVYHEGRLAASIPRNARRDADQARVDDVAVRCEEARVASLELDDLAARGAEHREIGRLDDAVVRDGVDELPVRDLDRDPVAGPHRVDVRERRQVGRAVSGDVKEPVLTGHERAQVAARPLLQRLVIGAIDEDHVHAHARHADAADRLPARRIEPVAACLAGDVAPLGGERGRRDGRVLERLEAMPVLSRQLVLAPLRVEGGERVLPLPHDDRPDERERAGDDQDRSKDAGPAAHQPSSASATSSGARVRRRWTARYVRRKTRRTGPRGGRSETAG